MVSSAVMCIDKLIALFIPTTSTVLGLPILLSPDILVTNPSLGLLAQLLTLPSILSLIILVIGYSVVTRASIKKSIIVIGSVEVIFILLSMGIMSLVQMITQGAQAVM
jgi:hypothetical protein